MKIKDILLALEELENNEEKLNYLKELLKKEKDEELIEEIQELINELEENLEAKLQYTIITPQQKRIIELEEVETDIETQERQITRQRPIIRPDLNINDRKKETEVRYDLPNTNYKEKNVPVYQNLQSFSTYESIAMQNKIDTAMVEKILVQEDIVSLGQAVNDVQKEQIRGTIERFMPHASVEEKIAAEQQIVYHIGSKDKGLKYMPKLK